MYVKAVEFILITYGFLFAISAVVALLIKGIALFVQRGEKDATTGKAKE